MDPITAAIVGALTLGTFSDLTEATKTSLEGAYDGLKNLLVKKFGKKSEVVQAVTNLEVKPDSIGRQRTLQEEVIAIKAEQDTDIRTVAQQLLTIVKLQQAGLSKFTIQNNASVLGQTVGDYNTITHHFGKLPETN